MEIAVAKTAGFCFGVNRAVKIVDKLLTEGEKVCTPGAIIHNPEVVESFRKRGAVIVKSADEVPLDATVVIRSHGSEKSFLQKIKAKSISCIDATCPFVKKTQKIAEKGSRNNKYLLMAGNEAHPEVIGVRSYFNGASYAFKNLEDLKKIIEKKSILTNDSILAVAQTTFSVQEWLKCTEFLKACFTNIKIYDTICNTTQLRQLEAEKLSKISDFIIVIGGKNSSNTAKLYDICRKNTNTVFVESAKELSVKEILKCQKVGIVAGASTPQKSIEEVKDILNSE